AAVVLGRDGDARLRPDAAVDLEVPAVPARIDGDQVLARDQELHDAAEERLLLVPVLAPVARGEGPPQPVDARRLVRPLHVDALDLADPAEPPGVALERADERPQVREHGDERARA